ncbi:MAG: hypothetical protein J6Y43_01150, partial [Clostridia bacterium]|nr:hypothetical protein [Clostridia bacterium]
MRTNSKRVSLFVLVALFVASFIGFAFSAFSTRNYASGEENALVYNGVSGYKLVVPGAESANTPIYCAAYFMRERIKEATGITLPDVYFNGGSHTAARTYSGTYTDTERVISFGSTDYLESSGISFDDSALKDDGFYLKTQGKSLFIYGKTERGIANGMLEVLERLGFEFYGDEIYVPELTNVYLPDLNICDNPDFDMRSYGDWYCQHSWLTDYTLRMTNAFLGMSEATPAEKNNMIQYGVLPSAFFNGEDTDGNNIIASLSPTHNTATDLVPYNTYFADHPEWYYVNDGHVLELCWSNVGLNADGSINTGLSTSPVKVAIERIKEYILNTDASVKYFFIGQEDKATGY